MQTRAVIWIRWALHALVLGLTSWSAAGLNADADTRAHAMVTAGCLMVVYLGGVIWLRGVRTVSATNGRDLFLVRVWLVLVLVCWGLLLWFSPIAAYIAFPLFFLSLHLLGPWVGTAALVVTLLAAITALAGHQGRLAWPLVLGPSIGALVAAITVFTFDALLRESNHRAALIAELEATRADLATAQHDAGVYSERERLAGEIHDTLAQSFLGLGMTLDAVAQLVERDPQAAAELIDRARQTVAESRVQARQWVAGLAADDLTHTSLEQALARLAERSSGAGLLIEFVTEVSSDPPARTPEIEIALLRVAQSAIANVIAHAEASHATLELSRSSAGVSLTVTDNGIGFSADDAHTGFGVSLMRRRMAAVGGTLRFSSPNGAAGTQVEAVIQMVDVNGQTDPEGQP